MRAAGRTRAASRSQVLLLSLCGACAHAGPPPAAVPHTVEFEDATEYRIETTAAPVRGTRAAELEAALTALHRRLALPVAGDGRLALLAGRVSPATPRSEIERTASTLGLVDGELAVQPLERRPGESWRAAARRGLHTVLARARPTHYGAHVFDDHKAMVALGRRVPALSPVPRELEPGAALTVRGRMPGGSGAPVVEWTAPDGAYRAQPAGAGPSFEVRLQTAEAGVYRVTVRGADQRPLVRLRVYVGVDPDDVEAEPRAGLRAGLPPVDALYAEVERLRRARGLRPLEIAPDLARAAAEGETPPGRLVLQGVVHGGTLDTLRAALAREPACRTALMHTDVTHVGMHLAQHSGGLRAVLVTARLQAGRADEHAAARVLAGINASRRQRGAPPLTPDAQLAAVARATLEAHLRGDLPGEQAMVDAANRELERHTLAYRRVAAVATFATSPEEAHALEPALDPAAGSVGVAVGSRTAPRTEGRRVAIVLTLAWPRR